MSNLKSSLSHNSSIFIPPTSFNPNKDNNNPNTSNPWYELNQFGDFPHPITVTHFDSSINLLWVGYSTGYLACYRGDTLERYASFGAHANPVRRILTEKEGVISISENSIRFQKKGGMPLVTFSNDKTKDLRSLIFANENNSDTIVLGASKYMIIYDLYAGRILKEVPTPFSTVTLYSDAHKLISGHANGNIAIRDPRTFNTQATLLSAGGLCDFCVDGNYLYSTNFKNYGEPVANVYDIRMSTAMVTPTYTYNSFGSLTCKGLVWSTLLNIDQPVSIQLGPEKELLVAGSLGGFEVLKRGPEEAALSANNELYQLDSDTIISMEISATKQAIMFGDGYGTASIWTKTQSPVFKEDYDAPLENVDYAPPLPKLSLKEYDPASCITLSLNAYNQHLLSDWEPGFNFPTRKKPRKINLKLLQDFRQDDYVGYASNPGLKRRQLTPFIEESQDAPSGNLLTYLEEDVQRPPEFARHVEIKHGKLAFGQKFSSYNKTPFAGLENILPNSYCNSALQSLYFIPQIRSHMINHLCHREFCLSCEMGFLFHMFDIAKGAVCQASSFLRSFRQIPQASGLGLIESPRDEFSSLIRLTENFNRFIFEQLHKESLDQQHHIIWDVFGSIAILYSRCQICKNEVPRESEMFQYDVIFPEKDPSASRHGLQAENFEDLICLSLKRQNLTKAWCDKCQKYQLTDQRRDLRSLPIVLSINAAASKNKSLTFWKKKISQKDHYLPAYLKITIGKDTTVDKLSEEEAINQSKINSDPNTAIYQLTSLVSHVPDPSKAASKHHHLIAQVRVNSLYKDLHSATNHQFANWYTFNDFTVSPCPEETALDFSYKNPAVISYTRINGEILCPPKPVQSPITSEVFFLPNPLEDLSHLVPERPSDFVPITHNTIPKKKDLIALDSEFVALAQEVVEIQPDGSSVIVNPTAFSLARVSLLRYDLPKSPGLFLDDYIHATEPVVDYLTKYSGIVFGDLDPKTSKHYVTTLKSVYLKIRYLIDTGCIFVGHGLKGDFRMVNVIVPPEQVIDTVELFHIPEQRYFSLRFLHFCLLGTEIQTSASGHSPIEDASAAYKVYQWYQEYEKMGEKTVFAAISTLYQIGRATNWQVPSENSAAWNPNYVKELLKALREKQF